MQHSPKIFLGFVATGKRTLRSGSEYEKYFNLSGVLNQEVTLLSDGNVFETVGEMQSIVRKTLGQTQRIANALKGATRGETANNIWKFLYQHVQYTKDNPLREQLRTPLRTWKDRKAGVDCDCYSIFISSVLTNLGVPHAMRIAAYSGDYQHVYVIVPKTGTDYSSYYTIDPVVDAFDKEASFSKKKDFTMKVTMLNGPAHRGFGACPPKNTATVASPQATIQAPDPKENVYVKPVDLSLLEATGFVATPQSAPAQDDKLKASVEMPSLAKVGIGAGLVALAAWLFSGHSGGSSSSLSGTKNTDRTVQRSPRKRLAVAHI